MNERADGSVFFLDQGNSMMVELVLNWSMVVELVPRSSSKNTQLGNETSSHWKTGAGTVLGAEVRQEKTINNFINRVC